MAPPVEKGSALSGAQADVSAPFKLSRPMGLAHQWFDLRTTELSQSFIKTIQNARASSTTTLND